MTSTLINIPADMINYMCGFLSMQDALSVILVSSRMTDIVYNNMRLWWAFYHARFPVKIIGPQSIHHDGDCRYGVSTCRIKAHYTGKIDGVGRFKGSINYRVKMAFKQKRCDRLLLIKYSDLPALVHETCGVSARLNRRLDQAVVLSNKHKKLHKALSLHNIPINHRYKWLQHVYQ
jgi:hypothetical protein